MQKLGIFETNDAHQNKVINEAADNIHVLHSNAERMQQQVGDLQRIVRQQQTNIDRLLATLQAVCDALVDLDLIDEGALRYRIDAAIADIGQPLPGTPFNNPRPDPPTITAPVCAHCGRSVPPAQISFTDRGPTCDACVATLAARAAEDPPAGP